MPEPLTLFNTLSRQKEPFVPIKDGQVGLYCCGPTVYARAHIGNLRTYIFEDLLRRTLSHAGYDVKHVMNITDVGHLQSDADEGDDKMSLAAKAEKRSPWDIARAYEDQFFEDTTALNILKPDVVVRATETIPEMIAFIQELERKGYSYAAGGNVYFNTSKFPHYADLARLDIEGQKEASRENVSKDAGKKNPQDFVLWFTSSKFPNQIMKWDSPWGEGFPGWHIECSVMASMHLGNKFDIHCGGIDHIPVHHTNEIAQSECYHDHKWVNYWMHGNFLTLDKGKMSKSKGGTLTLDTVREQGFHPMHYRYLALGAHYRSELMFSWEAMEGARNSFEALRNRVVDWGDQRHQPVSPTSQGKTHQSAFWDAVHDDLNTPIAMAALWGMVKDNGLKPAEKFSLLRDFDQALGLGVEKMADVQLPKNLKMLIAQREEARQRKDWKTSDQLRAEIMAQNVVIKDTPDGPVWYQNSL